MKGLRLHWDANIGWILDTPIYLDKYQLEIVKKFSLKIQEERLKGLINGDKKEELKRAITNLRNGKIKQRIIEKDGVFRIF